MPRVSCDEVIRAEHGVIEDQRARRGIDPKRSGHVGLALSGGGIRSASFAIGVLQGLHDAGVLKHVDYLSTVSGGGYAGSAYTWSNHQARVKTRRAAFPFGSKGRGARTAAEESPSTPLAPDALAYIRQHGNYLMPTAGLSVLALAGVVLRNIIVCFSVYTAGLVAAVLALGFLWPIVHPQLHELGGTKSPDWDYLLPAGLLLALFAVVSLLYSLVTWFMARFVSASNTAYSWRVWYQVASGGLLALAAWFAIGGSVPIVIGEMKELWTRALLVSGTSGVGLAGVVYEFLTQHRKSIPKFPRLTALRVIITAAALLYGWLLIAYELAAVIDGASADSGVALQWRLVGVLAYFILFGLLINTNLFGVGRMYRDRLMEAFMPSDAAVQSNTWRRASEADNAFLPDVCTREEPGPYHLINSNVILTQAQSSKYRNRAGDNFVMANLYCGSDATGWYATRDSFAEMSLATAIAISGAAVNPNTGGGGEGLTRNQFVAFMLALFNIRLGYWVRNPRLLDEHPGIVSKLWPNLLQPGLRQGLLGSGQHENATYLELTDGGHFDNTGLYELIRRQVDTIVLSLASADPDYSLEDFAIAVERARADFGVSIDFAEDSFKNLAPGSFDNQPPVAAVAASVT
ncbi:MAG: patatin-like phospholipase family protein, partial [Steroidobacterales bacterium]